VTASAVATGARPDAAKMVAMRNDLAWSTTEGGDRVDLLGADRVRFLQNLTTADVAALIPGRSARGFFTTAKGGVLSAVTIAALEDRFRLRLPAGRGAAVAAHLSRYRIAERVELVPREDLAEALLRGPRAPELLAALGAPDLPRDAHAGLALGSIPARLERDGRGPEPRYTLETTPGELSSAVAALLGASGPLASAELGADELELARIEDGELRWGVDYGEENFPQEVGDEAAVSFTKGCYLGQEVVARIQYRGGVQRLPRRLEADAGTELARGAELVADDGRAVGRATSVAFDPATERWRALALIHRRAAAPGTRLTAPDGATVTVVDLAPSA
jgi:folate-binding protein YgfZ